ncbi:hypothetical protein V1514DRAFT_349908 [Lipomyces japonicus]|uniref:uncharacterized protein n=1 Tax=Lipomyces japonicus TaxID=56871 RepID=UPI0034CF9BB9
MPPKDIQKKHRRKRLRKSRTEDFSTDSDSSSSEEEQKVVLKENDKEMKDELSSSSDEDSDSSSEDEVEIEPKETSNKSVLKEARATSNLLPSLDKADPAEFEAYYTNYLKSEFSDCLKKLREKSVSEEAFIKQSTIALLQGVNIFNNQEQHEILASLN